MIDSVNITLDHSNILRKMALEHSARVVEGVKGCFTIYDESRTISGYPIIKVVNDEGSWTMETYKYRTVSKNKTA